MSPSIECILEMLSTSCNKTMWPQANFNLVLLPPVVPSFNVGDGFNSQQFCLSKSALAHPQHWNWGSGGRCFANGENRKLMLSFDQGCRSFLEAFFRQVPSRWLPRMFPSSHVLRGFRCCFCQVVVFYISFDVFLAPNSQVVVFCVGFNGVLVSCRVLCKFV